MTKGVEWRKQDSDKGLELLRKHWGKLPFRIKVKVYRLAVYDAGHPLHQLRLLSCPLLYVNLAMKALGYYFLYQFIVEIRNFYKHVLGGE